MGIASCFLAGGGNEVFLSYIYIYMRSVLLLLLPVWG